MTESREGPGLSVRWLMAAPLILAATVLPSCGQLALRTWREMARTDSDATFAQLFTAGFTDHFAALFAAPLLVTAVFLLLRPWITKWPAACLAIGVWAMLPGIFFDRGSILPNLSLGAGLILANHELGRLAVRRLTSPIARDLGKSALGVTYVLPGGRLRIQHDALLLDLPERKKTLLEMKDLRTVTFERLPEPTSWQPTPRTTMDVPAGPVLRMTTNKHEWLLPVDDLDGEVLVSIIVARARRPEINRPRVARPRRRRIDRRK